MNSSTSMCKGLLVLYFNEVLSLQNRERVCNRSLYPGRLGFPIGVEGTFFSADSQRAHRIDIRGIRLEIIHLVVKTSNLLREIKLREPGTESVDQIRQGLIGVCLNMLVVLKDELEVYLSGNQFSFGTSLTPENQVNADAIAWNRELVNLCSEAYDVLVRC